MAEIRTYKSYLFVDKDPAIDQLRTIVQDSGESYDKISELSGVAATTLYAWFHGITRRPQNASLEAVGRALGYKREFIQTAKGKSMAEARAKKEKSARKKAPAEQRAAA